MSNLAPLDGIEAAEEYLRQPYARIILPEADGTYRGEILEFPGCISTGDTASEALSRLEEVAKSWLLAALDAGQNIPRPIENSNDYSGRLVLRLPKSLHKKAAWVAEREGVSLNQLIVSSLAESIGEKNPAPNNVTAVQYLTIAGSANVVEPTGVISSYVTNYTPLFGATSGVSAGTTFHYTSSGVAPSEHLVAYNPIPIGRANAGT